MRAYRQADGPSLPAFASSQSFPKSCDVAIVGGGIVGVSAAWALASRGISVALFEKGRIAGEQSSRNWGWVRQTGRDLRELPLMQLANRLWDRFSEELADDTGLRRTGILYTARSEEVMERHARWAAHAKDVGIDSRIIDGAAVERLVPGVTRKVPGAIYTPADGRAEPQRASHAIAAAAVAKGAVIVEGCAVRAIETQGGRTSEVVTERGLVHSSSVIVAGGAWSQLMLRGLGVRLPQLKVLSSVLATAPVEAGPRASVSFSDLAVGRRLDGSYLAATSSASNSYVTPDSFRYFCDFLPVLRRQLTSVRLRFGRAFLAEALDWKPGQADRPSIYEAVRILSPAPDAATLETVRRRLAETLPAFRDVAVARSWSGMIDTLPDVIPVISQIASVPGCFVATGFSGHGFGIGPGAGQVVAELATGERPSVDLAAFNLERFGQGSKLEVQSWL
ncbi:NAD(P)/FAD-dependent oxidoreductase [Consotaella aegiceratis]|uniref:NAD(P)/FAD-dependent oxidoreductase n=1 Tax=Consotaella aegiceratis TaxID=3097961 RepID=UPI002F3F4C15